MHPDHVLLVTRIRHRELIAEAEDYRQARIAERGGSQQCPPAPVAGAREAGAPVQSGCRTYPGRRRARWARAGWLRPGLARLLRGHRATGG